MLWRETRLLGVALAALALPLCGARAASAQQPGDAAGWITFAPADEAFSARMPVKPSVGPHPPDAASPIGRLYTALGDDSVAYRVWSIKIPPASGDQVFTASDYLDSCAELAWNVIVVPDEERARRDPKFRPEARYGMSYERDAYDGYYMREYSISLSDRRGGAYIFTDGSRAYVAAAYGPAGHEPNVDRFLDSFAVKRPGAGGPVKMPRRPIGDQPGAGSGGGAPGIGVGQGIGPGRVGNAGGGERAGTPEAARPPGAPCGGDERTFRPGEVTRRARLLTRPEPVYTVWARRFYVTGAVRARAILKADGTVGGVAAITRLPHGLTRKALEAMSAIKFEPAEKDGCKVSQYVTIDYNFNIY